MGERRLPTRNALDTTGALIDWQDDIDLQRVMDALLSRSRYRDSGAPIEVVQTHISTVFLTPEYVFKFKRPRNLGFVDFRALTQRLRYCRAEVRLNRRLAPDVYLDVLPLWADQGRLQFEPGEVVVDYCVVMRRLAAEDMMDARLAANRVSERDLDALAALLVRFHHRRRTRRTVAGFGSLDTLRRNWEENFQQVTPYLNFTISSQQLQEIHQTVFRFMASRRALLEARVGEGFIRDGHGDLRCEHVYLGEELKVIDCIEFNDRFRFADVASDLAFLLMDLTLLGHPGKARYLMGRYVARTRDRQLVRLVPFYACYRAFVRGKVLSMKLADERLTPPEQLAIAERARKAFALADAFAHQMRPPALLVIGGLMGTGKSTLAEALARQTGAVTLNSDRVRKELAARSRSRRRVDSPHSAEWEASIYTPAWTDATYAELMARARAALDEGRSVILDASFSKREHRRLALQVAAESGAEAYLVECWLPDELILERLAERARQPDVISDGRPALYWSQKSTYERMEEGEGAHLLRLRTDESTDALAAAVLEMPGLVIPPPLFSLPDRDTSPS